MNFSLVTIVYDSEDFDADDVCQRIASVYASGVASGLPFDLIVIDNSPRPIVEVQNLCCDLEAIHQWNSGFNVYHGGGMNIAAKLSRRDAIIYFCAGHGRVIDQTWIADILAPLSDRRCGISGCLMPCLYDRISADPNDHRMSQQHIQGAICAMRRETLLEVPYGNRFPHNYSDVAMCLSLLRKGYYLADVPSVRSVGIGRANLNGAKIVHDYA